MRISKTIVVFAAFTLWGTAIEGAAADPVVVWHRQPAFSVEGAAADGSGHVYVAGAVPRGETQPFGQAYVMVVAKFDADGTRLWTRTWRSGVEGYPLAIGFDVAVSPDGRDVYVAGGILIDSGEAGKARLWAYTSAGKLRWSRQTPDVGWWVSVAATDQGVLAGARSIASWTREGELDWVRPFLDRTGDRCFWANDVGVGSAGAVFAAGLLDVDPTCNDSEGGNLQDADIAVQKRGPSGAVLWSTILKDPGERDVDQARAVDVAGSRVFVSGTNDGRAWFARLTTTGRMVWARAWDGSAIGVSVAPWGPVQVLTDRPGTMVLRAYTPAGGELLSTWKRSLGGEGSATAITTGWGRALYITARSLDTGDLWRLRP